jgi:hypothetical protein
MHRGLRSGRPFGRMTCGPTGRDSEGIRRPCEERWSGDVLHYLTLGHLDPAAIRECAVAATMPLDAGILRRVMSEFPHVQAECSDGGVPIGRDGYARIENSVVVKAEVYDRLKVLLDDGLEMSQVGLLVESAMRDDDLDDPILGSYQKYRT